MTFWYSMIYFISVTFYLSVTVEILSHSVTVMHLFGLKHILPHYGIQYDVTSNHPVTYVTLSHSVTLSNSSVPKHDALICYAVILSHSVILRYSATLSSSSIGSLQLGQSRVLPFCRHSVTSCYYVTLAMLPHSAFLSHHRIQLLFTPLGPVTPP